MILLATPFAAIGVGAIGVGLYRLLTGAVDFKEAAGAIFIGLVFSAIGFGWIAVGWWGQKEDPKNQQSQSAHPDSPWMWRDDWAAGHISSSTKTSMVAAWGFALFANAIAAPLLFFLPSILKENRFGLVALMFPVIGACLLYRAIRLSMQSRKFGISNFVMSSVPGVVGGKLQGFIEAAFDPRSARSVTLKLTCIRRVVHKSSDGDTISEGTVWRDERVFETGRVEAGPSGCRIPVLFQIPSDAAETNTANLNDSIHWRLDVAADVPGIDYGAQFEVPVFRTKDSSTAEDQPQTVEPPKMSRIRLQPAAAGGTEFIFPAARNPGIAAGVTLIFLIWSGLTWFLASQIPASNIIFRIIIGIFTITFGAVNAALLLFVVVMWVVTQRVSFEAGWITIRWGLLGLGWTRRVACSDVSDLKLRVALQTGDGSGMPYYDIQLICRDGRKRIAGTQIRNKREAVWLMGQMQQAIRL